MAVSIGGPGKAAVKIEGLDDFRNGLKKAADPKAAKDQLKRAEKVIAQKVARTANANATGAKGATRHYPKGVKGKATAKGASVYPFAKRSYPAFWGAKPGKRTGWNHASYLRKNAATHVSERTNYPGKSMARAVRTRRNLGGKPQFPLWIGNTWDIEKGEGPYAIAPAVNSERPFINRAYLNAMAQVARKAFPEGS